jgi:DNA-directed RNA polymerase subunit RPC12/RpoP
MTDQSSQPRSAASAAASPQAAGFPCTACGARVEFAPGTAALRCPYCGHEQAVPQTDATVREHSYQAWYAGAARLPDKLHAKPGEQVLICSRCGARTESSDVSTRCPFCAAPLVTDVQAADQVAPEAVVPFDLERGRAEQAVRGWISSRHFAPSSLKKVASTESLQGTDLPLWTYDADTTTEYRGERGDHYWDTETYTETVDGRTETRTRQVQRTRWRSARGTVQRSFDDLLVAATTRVRQVWLDRLTPWPLDRAVPYQPHYLSGYRTLRYDVEPDQGLTQAQERMTKVIREDCRHDIGGDEQRVRSVDTRYDELTFKLLLLPVWIAAYVYAGRTFQVLVNAHTGEVIGERPYSVAKIVGTVLAVLAVIVALVLLYLGLRR